MKLSLISNVIKRAMSFVCFASSSLFLFADDIIVLRNGDIINAIVKEVQKSEIKYKKVSNPDGPLYSIEKSDVLSIKYTNGEIDKFEALSQENETSKETTPNNPITALPAEDNDSHKAKYAQLPRLALTTSNKKSKDFFPIMAFTDASVISTNELMITITPQAPEYYEGGWRTKVGYVITFVNKTGTPIYIDRAKSFKRNNNNETISYYNNENLTVTHGRNSGLGVGIGIGGVGVGVGGGANSSFSKEYGDERFLVVGPYSVANLKDYQLIRLSQRAEFAIVSDIEYWGFDLYGSNDMICQGEVRTYTESNTLYKNGYYITYSTDSEFKNSYVLNFELYAKYLVGAKVKSSVWSNASPEHYLLKEINKVAPDFRLDGTSIIGISGQYK